jgi:hypothetical protein
MEGNVVDFDDNDSVLVGKRVDVVVRVRVNFD